MISWKLVSGAALAALLAACATTDDGTSQNARVAANANVEPGSPDEMVCTNERMTGQMIPRRVCMTRAEREALRRDAVESFDDETTRNLRVGDPAGQGGQ